MTGKTAINFAKLVTSEYDRVVAAEMNHAGTATLFRRTPDDQVVSQNLTARPWLLISGPQLAEACQEYESIIELTADGDLNYRVHFPNLSSYRKTIRFLKDHTGMNPTDPKAPYRVFNDLTQQVLAMLPTRLFRGMNFEDIHRLQLDIETITTPGFDFPNPDRKGDEIVMIAMRDTSGWEKCLTRTNASEPEILQEMIKSIQERDPDVIEGHNIFDFDLTYIDKRCKRHGISLNLGRDGSPVKARTSRFHAAETARSYNRYAIYGRHIVDTLQMVWLYDISKREMESHGLKAAALHFGVAAPERTYVEGHKITEVFCSDPARLEEYAMDDVRETAAISEILSPSYFYQAQLVPFSYQDCVTRGTATKIDALLVADYMQAGTALPRPGPARRFQGGLTASQQTGVFRNVWHADIQSLYPSILVRHDQGPATDTRNSFIRLLRSLRDFRLVAKQASRTATNPRDAQNYDALQASFKILINSFYGYLGFGLGTFNDFDLAESVTAEGRELLTRMVDFLHDRQAQVIELDTDGIYFVPPPEVDNTEAFEAEIQSVLPAQIDVDIDSVYAAMFGYKSKNYALLTDDGELILKGAALRSRGLEPFQRRYMRELIALLMNGGNAEQANELYRKYEGDILNHRMPIADFAKREVLSTPPDVYRAKLKEGRTRRSAAYELVLAADRTYQQGDTVIFYVTGNKKNVAVSDAAKLLSDAAPDTHDENIPYYVDKLRKLHKKFSAFIQSPQ
mgnify:FL=1